jgi:hypothetical protein
VRLPGKMKQGKAPGGSGITVEFLISLMREKEKEQPNLDVVDAWKKVVELVQLAFMEEPLSKSFRVGILVLIPRIVPDQYQGIALLEVIYTLISTIINRRIANKIQFHESVHGFCCHQGTNTAILEAKLRVQLAKRTTCPLFFVFLDLKKAYDTLDRNRTMKILQGSGIGPSALRVIQRIWDMDTMIPKQVGFYGEPFTAKSRSKTRRYYLSYDIQYCNRCCKS